eukprot:COSAG04_NODE_219_length_19842_cov_1164.283695_20_plen_39_part_00
MKMAESVPTISPTIVSTDMASRLPYTHPAPSLSPIVGS